MALGPRLDLRQSQSLFMTPQLRQAIKLLQYSNLEVSAFIEEELERNPLLERDEQPETEPETPAPDQLAENDLSSSGEEPASYSDDFDPERESYAQPDDPYPREQQADTGTYSELDGTHEYSDHADTVQLLSASSLTDTITSELDLGETYDPGGASDGGPLLSSHGGSHDFEVDGGGIEEMAGQVPNLREHLGEQLRFSFSDAADRMIGAYLIAMLDPCGRLSGSLEALAAKLGTSLGQVEAVRQRMQRFDPVGMFCMDLRECLAVQLAERNRLDPAMAALLDNLELVARRDLRRLMVLCEVDAEDLTDMLAELRALDPKPGAHFDTGPLHTLVPDVLMRRIPPDEEGNEWLLELNPETMPRLLVNHAFQTRIGRLPAREDRAFVTEKLQTANWLVKSLEQRAHTILRIAGEIMRQQHGFIRHGVSHMRPLILRDIADAVAMHESTVSRVTSNKYIATPRGVFELKYFFTAAIAGVGCESHSAEAVRHRIRALVGAETASKILSDDAIVTVLRHEGVDIARRTVAKYREALHIPSSVRRKREKVALA